MTLVLFSILALLVQVAIVGGVVLLIVRLVSGRDKTTSEGVGVLIRRFFVYTIMLAMLILLGIGIAGLIEAAWPGSNELTDSAAQTAISIAFVVVGLPVYVGLALYTRNRFNRDPQEQRSLGWAFYLTVALIGSLLTSMSLIGTILTRLVDRGDIDRTLPIHAFVWTAIWASHWWITQRRAPKRNTQIHLLLGSAVGLAWAFTGAFATITAVLSTVYDGLFLVSVVDGGITELLAPLTILGVGMPVLWWYWFRHARRSPMTPWWLAHVLLLGVLGGVVAVIAGAGIMLFSSLQWVLGDPSSSAAAHFTFLPGAATGVIVGGITWAYHTGALGGRAERHRSEVDRVYDYLLSGAGLVVAASGVTTLIVTVIKEINGVAVASSISGRALAAAITLIVIGAPLWWHYWSAIQSAKAEDATGELQSIARRVYLVVLFGVAAVVAVVSLIVVVFTLFEDLLNGRLGSATVDDAAESVALLLTAGALCWYHFAVFQEDRSTSPEEEDSPALREVIIVGAADGQLAEAIRDRTGASVSLLEVVDGRAGATSIPDVLDVLVATRHARVVVIETGDGEYGVVPINEW